MTDFIDSPTPPTQEGAKHIDLLSASWYPYDASEEWRQSWPSSPAAPAGDWAVAAARGIIHNLLDRRAIKRGFEDVDEEMDYLWKRLKYFDSINLIRVKNIIDTYGWLGQDEVGQQGASTIFLVIQHSDSLTQLKYVPKMREAVNNGKALPQNLALLEDRILTNQRKPQIYGSQVRLNEKNGKNEFFPIMDEPNVNKRRASVGLQPLEDYAKLFQIEYVLPKN